MSSIHTLLFQHANDPGFIIDRASQELIEINLAFAELTGWTQGDVDRGGLTTRQLVHPEDMPQFEERIRRRKADGRERYDIRLLDSTGEARHVEVSVATLTLDGKRFVVGSLRDVSPRKRLERTLQSEITRQRNMTYKAAQASVRIGQVLEKLRSVPSLARELLTSQSRHALLDNVVRELTAGDKFSYARVAIFVLGEGDRKGDLLCLADSATPDACHELGQEDAPLVGRAVSMGELVGEDRVYVIPMQSRDLVTGALLVEFHEFEKNLFDENSTIRRAQEDTVKTIGNLIGLGLENLDLYERLQHQALVDQLTGAHNRRYFEERVHLARSGQIGEGMPMAILLLDIDHFKGINDSAGHMAGDAVLVEVADLLDRHFGFAHAIARVGGDEFAVLATIDLGEFSRVAERVREEIDALDWHEVVGVELDVTVSIGVAQLSIAAFEDNWLMDVDRALYSAKQQGRNRVERAATR